MTEKNFNIFFDLGSSRIRASAFNKNDKEKIFLTEEDCYSSFKSGQINLSEIEKKIENIIFELEKKN